MRYPPYPRYKPSGIEWPGDVPEHWEVKRIRHLCKFAYGDSLASDDREDGDVPVFGSNGAFSAHDAPNTDGPVLVVGRKGSFGKVTYSERPVFAVDTTFFIDRRCTTTDLRWLFYTLSTLRLDSVTKDSAVPGLDREDAYQKAVAVPSEPEQCAIAAFLDAETAKLDILIEKERALIEKLQEKRTALISRTVTRGLPPDAARAAGLDPNPKLKPSGVEWLGDIPEQWEIGKFGRDIDIAEGQVDPEVEPYGSMLLVAPNHVESGTGRLLARESAAEQGAMSGKYLCRKGGVIYSKIRPGLAKATPAPEECLCSADMYPLNARERLLNRFLLWLLLCPQFTAWSVLEADRVAMPKINRETLNNLCIPVPSKYEQRAIADYLEAETEKLRTMSETVNAAIERLREYRSALITAAVTGKIDVRATSQSCAAQDREQAG